VCKPTIAQLAVGWKFFGQLFWHESHDNACMLEYNDILQAAQRLAGHVLHTPCVASQTLSDITGAQVFLKFENLQFTASFKERGACNKLSQLTPEQSARGVIAMSAGNHAQGVAFHAQRLGLRAVIVMLWCRSHLAWRHVGRSAQPRTGTCRCAAADLCAPL
jgi:tryptophan synthase beta subunit